MIEQEEGVHNKLRGWLAAFVTAVAVAMSVFHLYTAYAIVRPEHLRAIHVAFVLFLTFLIFPCRGASATASCGGTGCSPPAAWPPRCT